MAKKATATEEEPVYSATQEPTESKDIQEVNAKLYKPKRLFEGRPLKFSDPEALKARIDEYFASCEPHLEEVQVPVWNKSKGWVITKEIITTQQQPYTISGLAVFLDTTRVTLLDYERLAETDPEKLPVNLRAADKKILAEFTYTIKKAKAYIESSVEARLLKGGHPAGPIFNLKNNFRDWKDEIQYEDPRGDDLRKEVDELRNIVSGKLIKAKKRTNQ